MVEQATGWDFASYTRDRIFTPLGMTATGWFSWELWGQTLAEGFHPSGQPTHENGVSPYPSGNLRASAIDLARFMIMWTSDGVAANGTQVLAPGTVATALASPSSTTPFGFFWGEWWLTPTRMVWWHNGALVGVCTMLFLDPVEREGVVVLTNGSCAVAEPKMHAIKDRAFATLAWL
jgi:CubicO group peptidase (beta-lactamase class C family)